MRWIEIIRLRAARPEEIGPLAGQLAQTLEGEVGGNVQEARVLTHATVPTDLSVHLTYESGSTPDTTLGAQLVLELEQHGLAERSLWAEVTEGSKQRRQS